MRRSPGTGYVLGVTNDEPTNALKTTWRNGDAALGLWISTGNAMTAEVLGDIDFDYINIDLQHGLIDYTEAVPVMQALLGTSAVVTCRVPWNEPGIIGKVLDAGAMGVVIPMVNTPAEAEAAVAACRYAPQGSRSFGPIRAGRLHGPDYASRANAEIACIPMIETAQAIGNLDAILDVEGIDAVYIGPADLSISLGLPPGTDNDAASFNEALDAVLAGCKSRGIAAGIHSDPGVAPKRLAQGFQMVTVTSDSQAAASGARAALRTVREGAGGEGSKSMY